jgi:catechol 2,3-dioxygenase-like lactoylglutathione lyase family enzyme
MTMLKDRDSAAILAVKDLERARAFYDRTLGLERDRNSSDAVAVYRTGRTRLCLYVSDFAGTNRANAVVWGVGDEIEAIVADLAAKGVTFEQYEMPDATYANGIHDAGGFRMAWFKDPDGNILHINSGD